MLIDKPKGWTSHDVVAVVRRQLGTKAVGHAGTLDPFATGLLVVLVGRATRLARFVESERKHYRATVEFGRATDTEDGTGTTTEEAVPDSWPDAAQMDLALAQLTGVIWQRPPAFSAKHVAGKRSYRLAREGKAIDLPEVEVTIHELWRAGWTPPHLQLKAVVGRGTYLRALARDLGALLGIPAHCAELRRTAIGNFDVHEAVGPETVDSSLLLPPRQMVGHLVQQEVGEDEVRELGFGRQIERRGPEEGPAALIAEDGRLIAVAEPTNDARWQPVVVLEPAQ